MRIYHGGRFATAYLISISKFIVLAILKANAERAFPFWHIIFYERCKWKSQCSYSYVLSSFVIIIYHVQNKSGFWETRHKWCYLTKIERWCVISYVDSYCENCTRGSILFVSGNRYILFVILNPVCFVRHFLKCKYSEKFSHPKIVNMKI